MIGDISVRKVWWRFEYKDTEGMHKQVCYRGRRLVNIVIWRRHG